MSTIKHTLNYELKNNNRKVVGLGLREGVWKLVLNYSYAVVKQEVVWTFRIDSFCFHIGNKMRAFIFCMFDYLTSIFLVVDFVVYIIFRFLCF